MSDKSTTQTAKERELKRKLAKAEKRAKKAEKATKPDRRREYGI